MNIFSCDRDPVIAAQSLPDKHVCKMCIENAQMLAVALGDEYGLGWGYIRKKDGTNYKTKGFRNHPSSVWVRSSYANLAWTIVHGLALCDEYTYRYGKIHAATTAHCDAKLLFEHNSKEKLDIQESVQSFARAMPDYLKQDASITDVEAYRKYLVLEKPWAKWKVEDRKPTWWNTELYEDEHHGVSRALQTEREV